LTRINSKDQVGGERKEPGKREIKLQGRGRTQRGRLYSKEGGGERKEPGKREIKLQGRGR
jgi:hypothetical protein